MYKWTLYVLYGDKCDTPALSLPSIAASDISLTHTKTFTQHAPIVDFTWYPGALRHNLPSYCFVATVRECPMKLLDGRDGRVRHVLSFYGLLESSILAGQLICVFAIVLIFTRRMIASSVLSDCRSPRAIHCAA
jgi:hypothetical protein